MASFRLIRPGSWALANEKDVIRPSSCLNDWSACHDMACIACQAMEALRRSAYFGAIKYFQLDSLIFADESEVATSLSLSRWRQAKCRWLASCACWPCTASGPARRRSKSRCTMSRCIACRREGSQAEREFAWQSFISILNSILRLWVSYVLKCPATIPTVSALKVCCNSDTG